VAGDLTRKLLLGVDARGSRGVFSRGKPQYGPGKTAPNSSGLQWQSMAEKRLRNKYGSYPSFPR
jgi:hypothetical protein